MFSILIGYLLSMTLQIYIPCYFGNELSLSSEKLSDSLFHSNWIDESAEFKLAMKIFMENTKKPLQISVFNTFNLNLESFLTVVNSAYSFYNVMKTMKNSSGKKSSFYADKL
jgi:odorant receptor